MASVVSYVKCIHCGYDEANSDFNCRTTEVYCSCPRCGSSWGFGYYAENKHGKFDTKYEHAVMYGSDVFHYGGTDDPEEFEKDIKSIKETLEVVQYTFKKNNVWFVKDCLTGNIILWDDYEVARRV